VEIKDLYRTAIPRCAPGDTLHDVAKAMEEADSGFVAVVADGRLQGVISERDIVRATARGADPGSTTAAEFATTEVLTATPDEDEVEVARRMLDNKVRRLPVVSTKGDLLGMVSMRDLFTIETLMSDQNQGVGDA